jgi:hypothetical protein
MRRFILHENVRRYREALARATLPEERAGWASLLSKAEDELAINSEIWRRTCPHFRVCDVLGYFLEDQLESLVSAHGSGHGSLQIYDEKRRVLRLVAQMNFTAEFIDMFGELTLDSGTVCERAASNHESLFVSDVQENGDFPGVAAFAARNGIHAIQSSPIFGFDGELLGMVSTHFCGVHDFSARDRELCKQHVMRLRMALGTETRLRSDSSETTGSEPLTVDPPPTSRQEPGVRRSGKRAEGTENAAIPSAV